jgi:hypothetical protein
MDAITFEVLDRAVVHLYGDVDDEDAFGTLERLDEMAQIGQMRRDASDLLEKDFPGAEMSTVEVGRDAIHRGFLLVGV